jgi:NhaA family Na+:H+ antiporter
MNSTQLMDIGLLAGIGFTMSIFISNLAFSNNPELIQQSKISVLLASLLAALAGWFALRRSKSTALIPPAV